MLIVDDELSVRDSLASGFTRRRVRGWHGCQRCADAAGRNPLGHRLSTSRCKGPDGIELQRRMHEIDAELIVIMMTGYARLRRQSQL
jgi:DNA-binding NtrC family response regulator